jgi:hypothetical protein
MRGFQFFYRLMEGPQNLHIVKQVKFCVARRLLGIIILLLGNIIFFISVLFSRGSLVILFKVNCLFKCFQLF